jgi:hypothetical protein
LRYRQYIQVSMSGVPGRRSAVGWGAVAIHLQGEAMRKFLMAAALLGAVACGEAGEEGMDEAAESATEMVDDAAGTMGAATDSAGTVVDSMAAKAGAAMDSVAGAMDH